MAGHPAQRRTRDRAALLIHVHTKTANSRDANGEVGFFLGFELAALFRRENLLADRAQIFRLERRQFERPQFAVNAERRRTADFQMQVGGVLLVGERQ